jgi:dTDP-4-dehydrorhamnose 3,5-epimerase
MKIHSTAIEGLRVIETDSYGDERGHFERIFCAQALRQAGIEFRVRQSSLSYNKQAGTLRGMHWQRAPRSETKLVYCVRGAVYDVVIDLRPDSASYLKWVGTELNQDNGSALYIPAGCAHGFISLQPETELLYMMDEVFAPECATGLRWNDNAFGIQWPRQPVIIAQKDCDWPDYVA